MPIEMLLLLSAGIFVIAVLYSSVGHAGASGYIAIMTLLGLAPEIIKPTALSLNILVAAIASWRFWRAGYFNSRLFLPFGLAATPFAFLGGYTTLPLSSFKLVVGLVLVYSAVRLLMEAGKERSPAKPPLWASVLAGSSIGLLSGLTGTGGGIFLSPLLLFMGWAQARTAAAVSAVFILLNSTAGLLGNLTSTRNLPDSLALLLLVAGIGGFIGSHWGSKRLPPIVIKRFLALVLVIAGSKLVFG